MTRLFNILNLRESTEVKEFFKAVREEMSGVLSMEMDRVLVLPQSEACLAWTCLGMIQGS